MTVHAGFDVVGAVPLIDGLDQDIALQRTEAAERGDWAGVPLGEIAIAWEFSDELRETEVTIEGVVLRVVTGGVVDPKPYVLSDLIYIAEERDSVLQDEGAPEAAHQIMVELSAHFIAQHGPLFLCVEHGEPPGHEEYCDLVSKREKVSHIVRLADRCRAAIAAAIALRAGRRIAERDRQLLTLMPVSSLPPLPSGLKRTEDLERLKRRVADPVVDDWRRLEAWLDRQRAWSEDSLGVLPALVHLLRAECHRRGVCKNPECMRAFTPATGQQRYCRQPDCEKTRQARQFAKLVKCPKCGRRVSVKATKCRYCLKPLEPRRPRASRA